MVVKQVAGAGVAGDWEYGEYERGVGELVGFDDFQAPGFAFGAQLVILGKRCGGATEGVDAAFDFAAIVHPRDDFLSQITAFIKADEAKVFQAEGVRGVLAARSQG